MRRGSAPDASHALRACGPTGGRDGCAFPRGRGIPLAEQAQRDVVQAHSRGVRRLSWDRVRLERAVRALVANAMLFGDPSASVTLEAVRDGDRVRLSVTGGGPGPDDEEREHLFQRFFRGRSAANAGVAGSGFGLFTARGIAQVHGGDVRHVHADTFEIELPLARGSTSPESFTATRN